MTDAVNDGDMLYFSEEPTSRDGPGVYRIYRLPIDGSAQAQRIYESADIWSDGIIESPTLTANKIVIDALFRGSGSALIAIDRHLGFPSPAITLDSTEIGYTDVDVSAAASGDRIFFNRHGMENGERNVTAMIMDEIGNLLASFPRSEWVGASNDSHLLLAQGYTGVLRLDGLGGAVLKTWRLSDSVTKDITTLERGDVFVRLSTRGPVGLGVKVTRPYSSPSPARPVWRWTWPHRL